MYCAAATAVCNLEYIYHGHTMLEYVTGEVPRMHREMATPMDVSDILGDKDESFLPNLRDLLVEKHGLLEILRDDDARYVSLSRDTASSRRPVTSVSLRPGDKVSYEGQLYTLLSLDASAPSERHSLIQVSCTVLSTLTTPQYTMASYENDLELLA